ncbi:hypothetical protein BC829DRAFT_442501 [Chytridium lagenaria]|nr:hypothetical protein BC829DRAFT_442501 [Chytridium lagenaria]
MELDPTGPLILKLFGASPVLPSTISTAIPTRFSHVYPTLINAASSPKKEDNDNEGVFPKRVIPPQPTPTPPPSSLISTPNPTLTTDICTSILHVFQSDDKEGWEALVDTWMGLPPHVDVEVFKELDDMALESILDYIITPPRTPTAHLGTLLIPKLLTPTRHHQTRLLSHRNPYHLCSQVTVKALRSVKGSGVAFLRECGRGEVVGWQGEMVGVLEVAVGEVGKKGEG